MRYIERTRKREASGTRFEDFIAVLANSKNFKWQSGSFVDVKEEETSISFLSNRDTYEDLIDEQGNIDYSLVDSIELIRVSTMAKVTDCVVNIPVRSFKKFSISNTVIYIFYSNSYMAINLW